MLSIESMIETFKQSIIQMNQAEAKRQLNELLNETDGTRVIEHIVIHALEQIGEGWENGVYSLAQVYMGGIICEELMEELIPVLGHKKNVSYKMGIGVLQDFHALGKRIVLSVLRSGGYDVVDLGAGLSVEDMVQAVEREHLDILLISTLMLPSALKVVEVKEQLRHRNSKTKIIAGGAPFRFDDALWLKVGADADGKNASDVIKTIETLMEGGL